MVDPTPRRTDDFWTFSDEIAEALVARGAEREFSDGERIYSWGDEANTMFWLRQGKVRFSVTNAGGREVVAGLLEPGQWFGETAVLGRGSRPHTAEAVGATVLLTVSTEEFVRYADENLCAYRELAILLTDRLRLSYAIVEDLALAQVAERTARRLLGLVKAEEGVVATSQSELAAMVGATREAVGRVLNTWKRDRVVSVGYGEITVLDREALRLIAAF